MECPHCAEVLREHLATEGAGKTGASHCDGCGCCFRDGKPRDGVPVCAAVSSAPADEASVTTERAGAPRREEPAESFSARVTPISVEKTRGGTGPKRPKRGEMVDD